ncbi:HNH endonuclease signature motif containing protein [Mycobacteroides franklinii]|uniref:HNH endonuclease n=1 Tax=Mycobacteroides franklinii TaxID=948102 RepID=A0A4R5PFH1_9MYCO|nr:HNH endonuclease signature motif containing protein [Mycobacteroides franklinii]ORA58249.1 HNH endonuclease [Mycobacteroides franklinii]TDH24863.1 HNH endonuclease [Mycobacteroides franklinii]
MFDLLGDGELIDVISSSQRAEAQAASRRLSAIGVLVDRHADPERQDPRDRFAVDRWDEVAAQVAASQGITHALASHQMRYAYVLRHRLRAVARRFAAGDIDFRTVALIIGRTELLDDDAVVAAVDAAIVEAMPRWERWSIKRLTAALDALVYRHDPDAVRRTKTATDDRHIEIRPLDTGDPLAEIWGVLQTPHAVALDKRLNQLVDTVCAADPRTTTQRRADAIGALTQGLNQMRCTCADPDCTGRGAADTPVIVHLVTNHDTLDDAENQEPAQVSGFGVINSVQARHIAAQPGTRIRTLNPEDTEGYRPTRALDTYVRCRDQLCRFPGCSQPADTADLDHSIPYADGGHTTAGNLKALCRKHHLLKTFCGWHEIQEPDGTIIWKAPTGHTYVTTPAGGLLFANLTRARTRSQDRQQRRRTERDLNRHERLQRQSARAAYAKANPPPF